MKKFLAGVATGYVICCIQAAHADGAFDRASHILRLQKEGGVFTNAEVFDYIVYKKYPKQHG